MEKSKSIFIQKENFHLDFIDNLYKFGNHTFITLIDTIRNNKATIHGKIQHNASIFQLPTFFFIYARQNPNFKKL